MSGQEKQNDNRYDVIIVGAGPAGSTLGYELCRRRLRVLLLEKESFPRYKTCAGGIPHKVKETLGFDISPVLDETVRRILFTFRSGDAFVRGHNDSLIYTVERSRFDAFLLEKATDAGLEVLEHHKVIDVVQSDESVAVITDHGTFKGTVIAGADGANSVVARRSGLMKDVRVDVGLEREIDVEPQDLARFKDTILVDWGSIPSGYGWVFPKKDHLSVGIGGPGKLGRNLQKYLDSFVKHQSLRSSSIDRPRGHKLPIRTTGSKIVEDRVILVGDSAGLVDPFTGEGIFYAIKSAQCAAGAIAKALKTERKSHLVDYQKAVDRELMPELEAAQTILRAFNCFPHTVHRVVRSSDRVWRVMCRIMRGEKTYTYVIAKLGPMKWLWTILDLAGHSVERHKVNKLRKIVAPTSIGRV